MTILLWVFVIALVVILMLVFKAKEVRHKIGFVIASVICLFLIFSFVQVYKSHKIDLTTFDGFVQATKAYFAWLGQLFNNVKQTTSYAIKQDWGINSTLEKIK
jgi:glucan phosphoethanolaminetransferase (alkaline phosphatase superfamily)